MLDGDKFVAHLSGLPLESCLISFLPLGISRSPDRFVVFNLVVDHGVKDDCDLMCGCRDRRAWSQLGFHPAQVTAHRRRAVVEGGSGQAEQVPARFSTGRIPRHSVFPPLMSLSGQRFSQEAKCPALGHFVMSPDRAPASRPLRTAYRLPY